MNLPDIFFLILTNKTWKWEFHVQKKDREQGLLTKGPAVVGQRGARNLRVSAGKVRGRNYCVTASFV